MRQVVNDRDRAELLEEELEQLRAIIRANATEEEIGALSMKLRRGDKRAGGRACAVVLMRLLERSGKPQTRDCLFCATRTPSTWSRDTDPKVVNIRIVSLRKALTVLGFPNVILTVGGSGWCITSENASRIKTALNLDD